jgi:hypothetical protein
MSIMNKHVITPYSTDILRENQYSKLKKPTFIQEVVEFIANYKDILTPADLKVLNVLAHFWHHHAIIFPAHDTIAAMAKINERTVRKCLARLKDLGLVSTYRRWNDSLLYKLSDIFSDFEVRRALAPVCSVFNYLLVFFLFSPSVSPEGRLINNLFINPPSHLTLRHESCSTSKSEASKNLSLETDMEHESGVPEVLRNLKCMKLTRWGQIKLSVFPDEAILHAQEQLRKSRKRPEEVFSWFWAVCNKWCRLNNHELDWDYMESLKRRHKMPENAEMLLTGSQTRAQFQGPTSPSRTGGEGDKETGMRVKREEFTPEPKRELTFDEQIEEERKMLAVEKSFVCRMVPDLAANLLSSRKVDPAVRAIAEKMGEIPLCSEEECNARIAARKALRGLR